MESKDTMTQQPLEQPLKRVSTDDARRVLDLRASRFDSAHRVRLREKGQHMRAAQGFRPMATEPALVALPSPMRGLPVLRPAALRAAGTISR
jgi:hypothetical protein